MHNGFYKYLDSNGCRIAILKYLTIRRKRSILHSEILNDICADMCCKALTCKVSMSCAAAAISGPPNLKSS